MENHDEILNVVFDAIREYNSQEGEAKLAPARESVLIGGGSPFDSVAAVVFSSILEEHLERRFHQTVSVIDIFGASGSDFLDIGGLTDHVARKMARAVA